MAYQDESQIVLRLPADVVKQIDRIADYTKRDRSAVVLQVLQSYLSAEGADLLDEAEGIAELDRGEGIALDTVLTEARRIVAAAGKKRAS